MWALRRASSTNSLKARGLSITAAFVLVPNGSSCTQVNLSDSELHFSKSDRSLTSMTSKCDVAVPMLFSVGCRRLSTSSHADARSGIEENLETGLKDELESELMGETLLDLAKLPLHQRYKPSGVFDSIFEESNQSLSAAFDKCVRGSELSRSEVYKVLLRLHRGKLYGKALQLSEWLEGRTDFDFGELDYAYRVDLTAKVHGLFKAESYIDTIPKSFKAELVYRTLLAYTVSASLVKKSEQLFDEMRDLGLPITVFACNQMLLLYVKNDKVKIADILSLMVNEKISPSIFTYTVLIDAKGQSQDIKGIDKILEIMKANKLEPDMRVQEVLWRHYKDAGLEDKFVVVELQIVWDIFTNLYASNPDMGVGVADDFLQRKVKIHPNVRPMLESYMTVLREYAKIGDADNARRVFQTMRQAGFVVGGEPFDVLCLAYKNAKLPTDGLREKMKALQLRPNKGHGALSSLLEVFKKPKIESFWAEKSSEI